ncbi:glycosyltransferase [Blastococcus mobilis]|uniref:Glycosyltransferase, GT2 family n=1 Tax=Blastococcus mobilis TaxID=1938746 RepID=A0A238W4S9_9ACTN|nr:glycosyltransferase [Blastococcus mobilis]SNR41407.1 Glycosyltransferase, GT2 family [Blastococcus mobilis]
MSAAGASPIRDGDGLLGVVVVNYASSHLLATHLAATDLAGQPVVVVVVDNWSSAAERAAIETLAAEQGWHLVAMPDNPGFGAGVNAGIRAARAAGCVCFLLLNPDAAVPGEVVAELRRHVLREPMALVSPRIRTSDGADFFSGSRLFLDSGRIRGRQTAGGRISSGPAVEWVTAACLALHDDLLRRAGDFDESYFLYWEDVEFSYRCRSVGGFPVVRNDLEAVHDAGGTQGPTPGRAKSALYYRYNCLNRLRFAARHLPRGRLLRWVLTTPAVSREILLRGGRRQLLRQPALVFAAVRGACAGLLLAGAALLRGTTPDRRGSDRREPGGSVLVVHPGAELYGSDRMLAESVSGLVADGHRVVVALPGRGPLVPELEGRGARIVFCRMPVLRKSALTPRGLVDLLADFLRGLVPACRLIRAVGTTAVYVSTVTVPTWSLVARLLRRRVVLHVHEAESGAPGLLRRLLALPAVLAHRVVVNSRYSRSVLLASVPWVEARSVVVYNGVAGPPEVCPPRPRLTGPVRLLYVGRLSPRKGPQVAVATLAELRRRGIDARLALAGSVFPGYEWFETGLRAQVRDAGLADRVEFLGFVPDVWAALRDADVVLIPSVLDEPFGNTAVEAVLAARPVLVSASSGLLEAAAGYTTAQAVPPGDAGAWADAVQRAVADWPALARAAVRDADEARRRHDPLRYRTQISRLTTAAGEPS